MQTVASGDRLERCRLGANEHLPFACPDGCPFYEPKKISQAGWHVAHDDQPNAPEKRDDR